MAENENQQSNEKTSGKNSTAIGGFTSVEEFSKNALSNIVETTKALNMFPSGASRDLYSAYPTFGKIVDITSNRILEIMSKVLQHQNIKGKIERRQKDEQFELLTDFNDVMLERINSNLDEMAGIRKTAQATSSLPAAAERLNDVRGVGSWNISKRSPSSTKLFFASAKNIARSQESFKTPVDNSDQPFEPRIKEKPNSLKPLAILPEYDDDGNIESYLHPYEFELMKFEPSASQLEKTEAKLPKSMKNTTFEMIDKENQLTKLVYELRQAKEIAIDVEHHGYRSFLGISCLIQISTRTKDYIIDGITLRDELYVLNEVFTDSKILKILHGADLDIQWLQRDFGIYIVNMFDTHQAAKLLDFPRLSLSYLLKHFCNVDADKVYQLADWRIRPLPDDYLYYARQDTHYLIYIYELLRNELINKGNDENNLLKTVYQRSTDICKKRFIKPNITELSHIDMYRKSKRIFDNRQLFALKQIFHWRDQTARAEDESYGYVLPNHMMLQIAESLPREMQGILACCNPIPPLVRKNLHTLHQIILKARDQPLIKPIIDEQIENRAMHTIDFNDKLYCPHDLSNIPEFRDDLPTLLSNSKEFQLYNEDIPILAEPIVDIFETLTIKDKNDDLIRKKLDELKKKKFKTPYERYKAVIPYAEQKKLEEIAKEEEIKKSIQLCPETKQENDYDEDKYKLPVKKELKRKHQDDSLCDDGIPDKKKSKQNNSQIKNEEQNDVKNIKKENSKDIKIKRKRNESSSSSSENEGEDNQSNTQQQNEEQKSRKKRNKLHKKGKPLPKLKTAQSSNQPIQQPLEFDFSKVDFRQFQGGSQKQQQSTMLKPKFHGKSKTTNSMNKKFNKMFTFEKTNKK